MVRRPTMGSARQFAPLSIFPPVCFHFFSGPHRPRAIQNRMCGTARFIYKQESRRASKSKKEKEGTSLT
eukprot:scaffold22107_cov135-Isochrysis_galbana.AAC.2